MQVPYQTILILVLLLLYWLATSNVPRPSEPMCRYRKLSKHRYKSIYLSINMNLPEHKYEYIREPRRLQGFRVGVVSLLIHILPKKYYFTYSYPCQKYPFIYSYPSQRICLLLKQYPRKKNIFLLIHILAKISF